MLSAVGLLQLVDARIGNELRAVDLAGLQLQDAGRVVGDDLEVEPVEIGQRLAVLALAPSSSRCAPASSTGRDPRTCSTNGPELTGCAEKLLAFSSSVVPSEASKAFIGRIAVLKTVSAARIAGSVFLSLMMTVWSPSVVTSWIGGDEEAPDALLRIGRALQRPLHVGRRDRRSVGEFDAVAQVSASRVRPSSDTFHSVARPGFRPLPSSVGRISVS